MQNIQDYIHKVHLLNYYSTLHGPASEEAAQWRPVWRWERTLRAQARGTAAADLGAEEAPEGAGGGDQETAGGAEHEEATGAGS